MINGVRKIVVPVADQQSAKDFWTIKVGFEVVFDEVYGEERWIEVTPPDRGVVLVISQRKPLEARIDVSDQLPHSPIFFNCVDIEKTYAELCARGVRFPAPPAKMPFGWWSMFEDHEGTRYALGQW
jgi:predicted enzyme related to lactoylglutathione lyase